MSIYTLIHLYTYSAKVDYRKESRSTCWDVNLGTLARYLEASLWGGYINGVHVAQCIINTINWRFMYKNEILGNKEMLLDGLCTGNVYLSVLIFIYMLHRLFICTLQQLCL